MMFLVTQLVKRFDDLQIPKVLTACRFNHPQIFKAGLVTRSVSEGQF